jgi:Family of unknown function (DUF6518)
LLIPGRAGRVSALHTAYAIIGVMRRLLGVAAGGLAVGGLTLWLQGILPGAWNHLANSGAVWVLAAFGAGILTAGLGWRRPALAGTLALIGAVIGYYAAATIFLHDDLSAATLRGPLVWLAVACVAGPVFGLAGAAYLDPRPWLRALSVAAVGAVFLAEAAYLLIVLGYRSEAGIMGVAGLVAPVILGRCAADRWRGMVALVPVGVLAGLAFAGVFGFTQAAF